MQGLNVEQGNISKVFQSPEHAYTKGLLACRPALYPKGIRLPVVSDFMTKDGSERTKDNSERRKRLCDYK